jgi:hypothetical protein
MRSYVCVWICIAFLGSALAFVFRLREIYDDLRLCGFTMKRLIRVASAAGVDLMFLRFASQGPNWVTFRSATFVLDLEF